jgi:hypothetical protein
MKETSSPTPAEEARAIEALQSVVVFAKTEIRKFPCRCRVGETCKRCVLLDSRYS